MRTAWLALLGLSAVLLGSLWDWACTYPGAVERVQQAAVLCAAISLLGSLICKDTWKGRSPLDGVALVCAIALLAYTAIQAWNVSHAATEQGFGLIARPYRHGFPRSVDGPTTWRSWQWLLACMAALCMGRMVARHPLAVATLEAVVLLNGLGLALLISAQRFAGIRAYQVTGMFVNPNHAAAYLNLCLPLALFGATEAERQARRTGARSHPGWLLLGGAGVLVVALCLTGSRAGLGIAGGTLLAWVLYGVAGRRRQPHLTRRRLLLLWVLPVGAALLLLASTGIGTIEVGDILYVRDLPGRHVLYSALLKTWRSHPLYGTGAGTFSLVFPFYQPDALRGAFYRYAHCDPLQWLIELGLVGAGLGLTGLMALIIPPLPLFGTGKARPTCPTAQKEGVSQRDTPSQGGRAQRAAPSPVCSGSYAVIGMRIALAGVALHALVEFPLHSAPVALLACIWLGIISANRANSVATSRDATPTQTRPSAHRHRRHADASRRPHRP